MQIFGEIPFVKPEDDTLTTMFGSSFRTLAVILFLFCFSSSLFFFFFLFFLFSFFFFFLLLFFPIYKSIQTPAEVYRQDGGADYLLFTRMPGESYRWRFRPLL